MNNLSELQVIVMLFTHLRRTDPYASRLREHGAKELYNMTARLQNHIFSGQFAQ